MQWKVKEHLNRTGDTKIVTRFAWYPVIVEKNGEKVLLWLERYFQVQMYVCEVRGHVPFFKWVCVRKEAI